MMTLIFLQGKLVKSEFVYSYENQLQTTFSETTTGVPRLDIRHSEGRRRDSRCRTVIRTLVRRARSWTRCTAGTRGGARRWWPPSPGTARWWPRTTQLCRSSHPPAGAVPTTFHCSCRNLLRKMSNLRFEFLCHDFRIQSAFKCKKYSRVRCKM